MKVWNKIFETIWLFWSLICLLATIVYVIAAIDDASPLYTLGFLIGGPIVWFIGGVVLKFFQSTLGEIWFEEKT